MGTNRRYISLVVWFSIVLFEHLFKWPPKECIDYYWPYMSPYLIIYQINYKTAVNSQFARDYIKRIANTKG